MWTGILPAVTSKFKENGELDHDEMTRFFGLQIEAGCDGLIVCGSPANVAPGSSELHAARSTDAHSH